MGFFSQSEEPKRTEILKEKVDPLSREGRPPSQEKIDPLSREDRPPSQEKVDPSPPHALKAGLIKAPVVKLSQKVYSPPKNINILCSFSEH